MSGLGYLTVVGFFAGSMYCNFVGIYPLLKILEYYINFAFTISKFRYFVCFYMYFLKLGYYLGIVNSSIYGYKVSKMENIIYYYENAL